MITVYFFVIFMTGNGKAATQIGPFESVQQCNTAKQLVYSKSPSWTSVSDCYQGVIK